MTCFAQALNEEEKKMLSKYGKLPQRKDLLSQKLNVSVSSIDFCAVATSG